MSLFTTYNTPVTDANKGVTEPGWTHLHSGPGGVRTIAVAGSHATYFDFLGDFFFGDFALPEPLRAAAWRTSVLKADSSIAPPSWMSSARRKFPSRLELKRRAGSLRDAPLAKVSFTTLL